MLIYPFTTMNKPLQVMIINGPNLNLLGKREPEVYGNQDFESFLHALKTQFPGVDFHYFQSNIEGELIDYLHNVGFSSSGIILNAGGYTHTSVALRDAIAAIPAPVLEVHITNIYAREEFRRQNLLAEVCKGSITGLGLRGYLLAIEYFKKSQPR